MATSDRRSTPSEDEAKIQKSLVACWKDGIAAQVMIAIIDTYVVPFGLLLGATNQQVGILVAIPNLLGSLTLVGSVELVNRTGSRLRVLLNGVFFQAIFLIPMALLPFLPLSNKVLALTALLSVYKMIAGLLGPPWGSLVSDYLPAHRRGDYFGWRSRLMGITSLVSLAFWGIFLSLWKKMASQETAFMVLFLASVAARFLSCYYISQMAELPFQKTSDDDFTFWMFLKRFRESNFVKFVFYVASITFATHLAAPYFSVHMLRDLKFSYLEFTAISIASVFSSLVAFPIWGRHADVVGNARVLKTTSFIVPMIPLCWVFTHNVKIIFINELFAGLIWGGFNLCAVNYIYDAVSPSKRVRCLAYFNLINGLAIFAGSLLGGYLIPHLTPTFGYPLLSLFLLSSAGRFAAHFFLSKRFHEVRASTTHVSSLRLFFSVVGFQPMLGQNNMINALIPRVKFSFRSRKSPELTK